MGQGSTAADAQRATTLLESSSDVLVLVQPDGLVSWCSRVVAQTFGFDVSEVVGRSVLDFVHPDDVGPIAEQFEGCLSCEEPTEPIVLRVRDAAGTWRWGEVLATSLIDDPLVGAVMMSLRDVTDRVETAQALLESEARLRAVLDNSRDLTGLVDNDGRITWVSPIVTELLGFTPDELVGTTALDLLHPDDLEDVAGRFAMLQSGNGLGSPLEARVRTKDGGWVPIEGIGAPMSDGESAISGLIFNVRDRRWRLEVERDRQRIADIVEVTSDVVGIADRFGTPVYLNDAGRRFFGLATQGAVGDLNHVELFPMLSTNQTKFIHSTLEREEIWSGEMDLRRHDGVVVPMLAKIMVHRDSSGEIELYSGVLRDISERKAFEERLEYQATHDPLTGLPNRTLLLDRLDMALARSQRQHTKVAALFIDLDNFKVVNDSLGHSHGDQLLVDTAGRLSEVIRPGDTVARFGGDEFVVLAEGLAGENDARTIAKRVESAVSGSFPLAGTELYVGVSMGIALSGRKCDSESLIRDADAAMYRAKELGRGRIEVFDHTMRRDAIDRLEVEHALRRALDRDEFELHYQPIISLDKGAVVGVEALLRWRHPDRGLLLPDQFIGLAEETGLIRPIGTWVLEQACAQLRQWIDGWGGLQDLMVCINLSARQLASAALVDQVDRVLRETAIRPSKLTLEITESVVMEDAALSRRTLGELKELGVDLAIDDFGTGYSSLSYLRHYPFDRLKIDRSLVDDLGANPSDSAIVLAIVGLAHNLGMTAIAEGIETPDQFRELQLLGCDLAQGFLVSRPLQGDVLPQFAKAYARSVS